MPVLARERRTMVLIAKPRHSVVRLRLEMGPRDPALGRSLQHGQPRAGKEIVDESGDEDRLAGAGKPGDPQSQSAARDIFDEAAGDNSSFEDESVQGRQG